MSTDQPFTPPKKKPNVLWWLGGGFALLVFLFFLQLFGPDPRIVVSPQTTYITTSLGPDGLPDYEQHVRERLSDGVTHENNAAVLLFQALWPGGLDPKDYAAVVTELGLEQIPDVDEALIDAQGKENVARILEWLEQQRRSATREPAIESETESQIQPPEDPASTGGEWEDPQTWAYEVLGRAGLAPWNSQQIPPLAEWVDENKKPLDLIVEATRRPRLYLPSPSLVNNKRELLVHMLLPGVQAMREAARGLSARAMWHLGEGRPMEAWNDILALHRLSHLFSDGRTLIEQLVAIAISGIACENTVTLLDHGRLTTEQARQVQRELAALPVFNSVAKSLDEGERLWALDAITLMGTSSSEDTFSALTMGDEIGNTAFNVVSIDWNLVLQETNRWYDRLVGAAQETDGAGRRRALDQVESDIQLMETEARSPSRWLAGTVSRGQRGKLVASVMLNLFLPALRAGVYAEDRAQNMLDLTRLAAALAVYRAEHCAYPETLDELVPGILGQLPVDLYNGKPFVYKRDGGGYLLYSAGENGADDGGSNQIMSRFNGQSIDEFDSSKAEGLRVKIPVSADDHSIRAPRPKWEMPKLPAPGNQ